MPRLVGWACPGHLESCMEEITNLVARLKQGDRAAAVAVYDRFAPLVRAIAWDACQDLPTADDIVQDTFLRVFSKIDQLRQAEQLPGWIVSIARSMLANHARQRRTLEKGAAELTFDPVDYRQSGTRLDDSTEILLRAIAQLPESQRIAIHIHYLCEQPVETARQVLGLSTSGVYKLLEQARARLKSCLQHREDK